MLNEVHGPKKRKFNLLVDLQKAYDSVDRVILWKLLHKRCRTQPEKTLVELIEKLHNDSTTITFHGAYSAAKEPGVRKGGVVPAITWDHNKDHRPDLKQVLYLR